jgi:hypothetical protein
MEKFCDVRPDRGEVNTRTCDRREGAGDKLDKFLIRDRQAPALNPADLPQARRDHSRSRVLQLPRAGAEEGPGGPHRRARPLRRETAAAPPSHGSGRAQPIAGTTLDVLIDQQVFGQRAGKISLVTAQHDR